MGVSVYLAAQYKFSERTARRYSKVMNAYKAAHEQQSEEDDMSKSDIYDELDLSLE